jgi:hypothetical protein
MQLAEPFILYPPSLWGKYALDLCRLGQEIVTQIENLKPYITLPCQGGGRFAKPH